MVMGALRCLAVSNHGYLAIDLGLSRLAAGIVDANGAADAIDRSAELA